MSYSNSRWTLIALFLLSSTTFVQTLTTEIPYNDRRVTYAPKDGGWAPYVYNETEPCPGIWAPGAADGKHTISLSFTGTGIAVYGYTDGIVAPWLFQVDNGTPEALSALPDVPCRVIKDSQGLKDGKHQVIVTPQSSSFVLTKFIVTGNTGNVTGNATGNVPSGSGKNSTHDSRAFSLDRGSLAQALLLVVPVYIFIALL